MTTLIVLAILLVVLASTSIVVWRFTSFLPRDPAEYPTEPPAAPTIVARSEVAASLVTVLRNRANYYTQLSRVLLVATLVMVMLGLLVFLTGDQIGRLLAPQEGDLIEQIQVLDNQLKDLRQPEVAVPRELRLASELTLLWRIVDKAGENAKRVTQATSDPNPADVFDAARFIPIALQILRGISSGNSTEPINVSLFVFSSGEVEAPQRVFNSDVWEAAQKQAKDRALNLSELTSEFQELHSKVDVDNSKLRELVKLSPAAIECLAGVSALVAENTESLQAQNRALADLELGAIRREQQRESLTQSREELQEKRQELVDLRNSLMFMSWLPGIILRVGAVILLLFLTGVFLATYRYNISISAYYNGRADALRLVAGTRDRGGINVEQLQALVGALSPDGLTVDRTRPPV